jgi:hypothetical protein
MTRTKTDEPRRQREAFDAAFDALLDWRERCEAVQDTYAAWIRGETSDQGLGFRAYGRALDREEKAANTYAALVGHLGELLEPELSRQLAGAQVSMEARWS